MNEINASLNLKCKIYNVDEGEKSPSHLSGQFKQYQESMGSLNFVQRNFSRLPLKFTVLQ